jgi:uncharacterized protein
MWSPAHLAVEHQDVDALRELLGDGWDPDERDAQGMPLLHHAIDIEADGAAQAGTPVSSALTATLLENGANPGIEWDGQSALQLAVSYRHEAAVELLTLRLLAERPPTSDIPAR